MGLTKAEKAKREATQKRREAAKAGLAKKKQIHHTKPPTGVNDYKAPVGTITALSEANESLSLSIGANLGSLLQRMRMRLHGSESQGTAEPGKDNPYSPSSIVGPLERTRDNQEANLKMLLDLDSLLEEML
jgi:hypothetical protein